MTRLQIATLYLLICLPITSVALCTPIGLQKESERGGCRGYGEKVPKYDIARHYRTDLKPGLVLFVYIAPDDVARQKLIALSCKIGKDHATEQSLFVYLFDSKRGAKRFNPQGEGNSRQINLSYRGLYGFSREPGSAYGQSLSWRPDRNEPNHWITIDLGPPPVVDNLPVHRSVREDGGSNNPSSKSDESLSSKVVP
jgi:hypothetical protein